METNAAHASMTPHWTYLIDTSRQKMNSPRMSLTKNVLWILPVFGSGILVGLWLRPHSADDRAAPVTTSKGSNATQSDTAKPSAHLPESAGANSGRPELKPWSSLTREQRSRALEQILHLPDAAERRAEFLVRVHEFDRADIQQAILLIKGGDKQGITYDHEWEDLIRQQGRVGGLTALESTLAEFGMKQDASDWFSKIAIGGWAEKEPQAAIDWLNAHESMNDWAGALGQLLEGIGRGNPDMAAAILTGSLSHSENGDRSVRKATIKKLAEQVTTSGGMEGLTNWYNKIPIEPDGGATRQDAFGSVYFRIKHADRAAAETFLVTNANKPWRDDSIYAEYTKKLAAESPQKALEWATSLPASPVNGTWPAADSTFRQWLKQDSASATAWLSSPANAKFQATLRVR